MTLLEDFTQLVESPGKGIRRLLPATWHDMPVMPTYYDIDPMSQSLDDLTNVTRVLQDFLTFL